MRMVLSTDRNKFNVGDVVYVKYYNDVYPGVMHRHGGKRVIVTSAGLHMDGKYYCRISAEDKYIWWPESWFEPVNNTRADMETML